MEDCHDNDTSQRAKLPIIPIPEETETLENESPVANEMDQRLPPLAIPSSATGIAVQGAETDDTSQHLSPVGPSWVERQVAKVRQRKLWAFRQQQQQIQQKMDHPPPRAVLKRSVSLVVNVPDDESDRDSLDEEEDDQSQIELDEIARHESLVWQVMLDKNELLDPPDEPSIDYAGWPNFPARLAVSIQKRQQRLKERRVHRKEKNMNCNDGERRNANNSFIRRKRFGNRLSMALIRQRKSKINESLFLSNGQHPADRLANDRQPDKTNAEEKFDPAPIVHNPKPEDSGQQHSNDTISLQISECPDEIAGNLSSIHPDVVATIASGKEVNKIWTAVATANPPDAINEEDVTQPTMECASISQETIEADVYYHVEGLNPVADSLAKEADGKRYETAASAFRLSSACGRQEEITDESISDVTVDDGPHLIDQSNDTSDAIPTRGKKREAGMASRPDAIPPEMSVTDQIEYRIASALQNCDGTNKDSPARRRRPAYCSAWPLLISNQNSDVIPPAVATVSYWNNFQDPTSEKVHQAKSAIPSASTTFHPSPENDPTHPGDSAMMKNALDKKTKDAHNVSRLLSPSRSSVPTQTEPQSVYDHQEFWPPEAAKLSDPIDVKELREAANECQCLHRAVLTCLLPEAAETLANLELIRRQLKRARIRRQESEHQRQPLQARRDVSSAIDPNT
ncbi:hypothetical protein OUZ56_006748 [Daphnia magna]|uniref:Uncharacterized protein n=1 Tax=Daphnia magna TaxID=35525 RepID=A0ABQ9YWK1_9CRUS|nr:hypothetical protein OUZ56_006748 [Daphnia magna]